MLYQVNENILTFTIGDDDADASLLHLLGCGIFRVHAATAEGALLFFDIL